MDGPRLIDAQGRACLDPLDAEPLPAAPRASDLTRHLPHALLATLLVAVCPIVAVAALSAAGLVRSFLLTGVIAVVLSGGASWAGATWWKRRPESRDLLFCDLMIWGWVRRWHAERRLSDARSLLGLGIEHAPATDVRRERQLDLFESLAHALEARDAYTHGHTRRVTRYSSLIAKRLRLPREEVARVSAGAAVHDVGKINVPRAVLNKPGRLSGEEFAIVKRHPEHGAQMVALVGDEEIAAMVRHHHERLDGTGYPDGLSGDAIPLGARIIAVADTFDAITSSRAYRGAKSHKQAMSILRQEAGTQLDPAAVRAFCEHYSGRRGLAAWILITTTPQRVLTWLGSELSAAGLGAAAPWVSALAVSVPLGGSLLAAPLVSGARSGSRAASSQVAQHRTWTALTTYPVTVSPVAARSGRGGAVGGHPSSGGVAQPVASVGAPSGAGTGAPGTPTAPAAGSSAPAAPGLAGAGPSASAATPPPASANTGAPGGGTSGSGTSSSGTSGSGTSGSGTSGGGTSGGGATGGGGSSPVPSLLNPGTSPPVNVAVTPPAPGTVVPSVTATTPVVTATTPSISVAPGPILPKVTITPPKLTIKLPGLHLGP